MAHPLSRHRATCVSWAVTLGCIPFYTLTLGFPRFHYLFGYVFLSFLSVAVFLSLFGALREMARRFYMSVLRSEGIRIVQMNEEIGPQSLKWRFTHFFYWLTEWYDKLNGVGPWDGDE